MQYQGTPQAKGQEGDKHPSADNLPKACVHYHIGSRACSCPRLPGKLCAGPSCMAHRQGRALTFRQTGLMS